MNELENYSKNMVSSQSLWSKAMSIIGWILTMTFVLAGSILVAVSVMTGIMILNGVSGICGIFAAFGVFLVSKGSKTRKLINRYKNYCMIMSGKNKVSIKAIADRTSQSTKFVAKDLKKMIDKNYFKNTYVDEEENCIIFQNSSSVFENLDVPEESIEYNKSGNKDVDEICEVGIKHLEEIQKLGRDVKSDYLRQQIFHIRDTSSKIFDVIRDNPEKTGQIRKFMSYYLPTTIKLLKAYCTMEGQGINRENIAKTMGNIEGAISTIEVAFENQLDHLFENVSMDITTDITVLENLLAQEGLI